jgi:urease accessory protein
MRTVTKKIKASALSPALLKNSPELTLPFHERAKSRIKAMLSTGEEIAISLPRGTVMRAGEILVANDGRFVQITPAREHVLRVTAKSHHDLLRAAYPLGNRHIPVEVGPDYLHLEVDLVLADMLGQLGVNVTHASLPFEPEHGAYGGGHKHDQKHKHDHEHSHQHENEEGHVHSAACGHHHHR